MNVLELSRLQFAMTTIYHFFFVPLSVGMSIFLAILETINFKRPNTHLTRYIKLLGQIFIINFAMGTVTGLVQEFQFGMNWSAYSRFVGDIFGVPLALEALSAFFLESVFLGLWIFGRDIVNKRLHLTSIWLVALGSTLSAFWILVASSFMHSPVGINVSNEKITLSSFCDLLLNIHLWHQFPHVFFACISSAGFAVLAICSYQIYMSPRITLPLLSKAALTKTPFSIAAIFAFVGTVGSMFFGHIQAQHLIQTQPLKMAAAEALWESANPASLSLFSWFDTKKQEDILSIKIPYALSFLAHNSFRGEVKGIKELQAFYSSKYGEDNYVPPVFISYWSFRIMIGAGAFMLLVSSLSLLVSFRTKSVMYPIYNALFLLSAILPCVANSFGWILTEVGRQPWIVYGLLKTKDALSSSITKAQVYFSLGSFTTLYGVLLLIYFYIVFKKIRESSDSELQKLRR